MRLQVAVTFGRLSSLVILGCFLLLSIDVSVAAPQMAHSLMDTSTTGYRYEVSPTGWQCGTQSPATGILKTKFEPDSSTGKIRVSLGKCDGTAFSTSGTARIILDDTGQFENWQYNTSTTSYRCGSSGIIEFKLEPRSGNLELRGTARKCAGGNFSAPGYMYIASDGNIITDGERYGTSQSSESITFTPLKLSSAGRHSYQAYFKSDSNPSEYIISGSVDAWEDYHSYLSGLWTISPPGEYEYSFLFDPRAFGISGTHKYQVHYFPNGQNYPIRGGIISAWDVEDEITDSPPSADDGKYYLPFGPDAKTAGKDGVLVSRTALYIKIFTTKQGFLRLPERAAKVLTPLIAMVDMAIII